MSFFTALASAYGGYGAGKEKRYTLEEQRREADRDAAQRQQYQDTELDVQKQQLALEQQQQKDLSAKTAASNMLSGLDANGQPLKPYQFTGPMATYTQPKSGPDPQGEALHHFRLAAFLQSQGPQYAWQANQEMEIGKGIAATALTGLNQAKTTTEQQRPSLIQAQTAYWKDKPAEFKAQLDARLKIASDLDKTRIAAAGVAANAAAARATQSMAERESIALMAQLNAAGGQDARTAAANALAQWKAQQDALNKNWEAQSRAYALGIGPNPGAAPPQAQMVQPQIPPAPQVTYIFALGPNGQQVSVPVINRGGSTGGGGNTNTGADPSEMAKLPAAKALALAQFQGGTPAAKIADSMRTHKYSEGFIQQVISSLPHTASAGAPPRAPSGGAVNGISPLLLPAR
jgi:hypothetical protein